MNHAVKTHVTLHLFLPLTTPLNPLFFVSQCKPLYVQVSVSSTAVLPYSCLPLCFGYFFSRSILFYSTSFVVFFFYFNCLLLDYWCLVYFCNIFLCCRAFDLWPPYICKSNMKYLSVQPGFAITDQLPADASTEQKVTWTFLDL